MNRSFLFLFICTLLYISACQKNTTETGQAKKDTLSAKKEAVHQLLKSYDLDKVVVMSDDLDDYRNVSLEEYEERIKKFVEENKEMIVESKKQLGKEDKEYWLLREMKEKMENASTKEEKLKIVEEYRDALDIKKIEDASN